MVTKVETSDEMNIWLNPKYSSQNFFFQMGGVFIMVNGFNVITLCGSSKFKEDFIRVSEELSLSGNIVISLGLFGHADGKFETVITPEIKEMLDRAHRAKIDMSDAIYVINKDGYIGESTRGEIEYAKDKGKHIIYME